MERNRYKWIDSLRGYGALLVMLCHLIQRLISERLIYPTGITTYLLNGARAVQLFFIISGLTAFCSFEYNHDYLSRGGGTVNILRKNTYDYFQHIF